MDNLISMMLNNDLKQRDRRKDIAGKVLVSMVHVYGNPDSIEVHKEDIIRLTVELTDGLLKALAERDAQTAIPTIGEPRKP
jgi:hypothetical protein